MLLGTHHQLNLGSWQTWEFLSQFSLFGSLLTFGGLIGAAISGKIADLAGRRGAMCVSDAFSITGWLAIALSEGAWSLDLGRLSLGLGAGILSYVVPIYIAEISPNKLRGAFTSISPFMAGTAVSITFVIGSWINWRMLALLGIVPCMVQLLGLWFIPESPRWLAKAGRQKELEAALRQLRGKNIDISHEAAEINDYAVQLDEMAKDGILELFQQKYARAIVVGTGLMALQQFGGQNGYSFYLNFILESAGFPGGVGSVAVSVAQICGSISCIFLIENFGRRSLLMVSAAGMCLGSLITGSSFLLQDYSLLKSVTPSIALTGTLVFVGSISSGVGGIPWIIVSEIFPVNVKGAAGSFANLVNYSGSWIVAYTFNFLFEWSSAGVFFIYSIFAGLGVIFVAKLVPETKGRTLEEIQASIMQ